MPTLDWIGKKAVVNHHREVPYRLLHCDSELSVGDPDAGNLLVQGDNLEALKALLPYYAGKVKCIYIDPPYNTGNEGWVYNDNVNSPEMKSWLGKVVGKEAEDLSRHDKWLCMMYPRLRLLREFLREDGVIFVSIDGHEIHHAKMLLDEIFSPGNHKNTIAVRRGIKSVQSQFEDIDSLSQGHEYILLYSRKAAVRLPKLMIGSDVEKPGKWDTFWRGTDRHTMRYPLFGHNPTTGQWRWEKKRTATAVKNYEEYKERDSGFTLDEWYIEHLAATNVKLDFVRQNDEGNVQYYVPPRCRKYQRELSSDNWMDLLLSGSETSFDTEKSVKIVQRVVSWLTSENDLILDSFAGSGTTGHAVLDLYKQDGGNRKFILVEMDKQIASDITAERLKRIINGYDKGGDPEKPVEGLGGGFRYCRLGTPLFNEFGDISEEVVFPALAAHVFFSETGSPLPQKVDGSSSFLGTLKDKAVYMLFSQSEQGFAREASGNVLTPAMLETLPPPPDGFEGLRVVYAEGCTVSAERLKEAGVIFKQIPYQIEGN
ncbi:site-specific DNA-methyltransferase [uncultured Cohaesibacter sp.]|uniref:site-specific DNA-methyltransferase n=1 Tax=uncultured Cohaesibacter sp. TaxID=1002546 RepID=UPI0029310C73|nr:site-specific DNA-methyltransferase [uncultured Cohaesibacter sp.]